ncbi:hypothetical protein [Streptomyces sp. 135]|uniref:hypothetical protein n=1 Tax=Streptomyces sp. 135 TaxID=2838850 RepID=UPI001CBDA265|nr:hypothetical protein [Streptomyces sp. 135]
MRTFVQAPEGLEVVRDRVRRDLRARVGPAHAAQGPAPTRRAAAPRFHKIPVTVTFDDPGKAGGLAETLAIGTVAGLYPAVRAARLSPTPALQAG